ASMGKPVRIFSYAHSTSTVFANLGEQTPEEAKLGLADLSGLSPAAAGEKLDELSGERSEEVAQAARALVATGLKPPEAWARAGKECRRDPTPDETDVAALAALWSIDPTQLSQQQHPVGVGLVARLPTNSII